MIQLSLFPDRGYGLLGLHGELVEDWTSSEPLFVPSPRASDIRHALKVLKWGKPRVVRLERHHDFERDELTFVIAEVQQKGERR